ncbi:hypothetical protein CGRA01v4_09268 [Colletotrichum graminicola]|uniref:Uncharacterized protein n=1 Tax=Colletotrichum graminicola (strain M1.001 / M2 / FGSC 10212) TaxID=645133 RepID=E3R061_COLGM|nr:uncharacterized protein GLRG_11644 [Colletotrichum graminicola M1.001]EFQ36499.1 hypothetical protein GLRG_11644 [Colletotrichum graminicola M1.001]WDK17983.1 hypothetical protein CGRA01v4_09268 [Colletotrichum graminicola]
MVSFFGLKLGADKKKKAEKAAEQKPQWKKIDQNLLGQGQFFGKDLDRPVPVDGSRPGTAMSSKSFIASFRQPKAPYMNGGSSSLVDLGAPGGGKGIRPVGSEANLNMRWNNSSVTSLQNIASPPIITGGSRPGSRAGTPTSISRKVWVNPLDVHFARDNAGSRSEGTLSPAPSAAPSGYHSTTSLSPLPTPTVANAPRSPLGQFEFNLNPSETSKDDKLAPAPLSPSKAYPSPPLSVNGSLPRLRTDFKPKTSVSTVHEVHQPRPAALPSPTASAGRCSDEEQHFYPRPIIQNVAAKRDTLTIITPRRQSLSMDIDEDPTALSFGMREEQSPTVPVSPPPKSARRPRPPEMKSLPQVPRDAGPPPPRPQQVPYEGPLRITAQAPGDVFIVRQPTGWDLREKTKFEPTGRVDSDARDRLNLDYRERSGPDGRDRRDYEGRTRNDRLYLPQGYLGPPPVSRRVAPGEGERSYGITPANRRRPPPPVELQRKAPSPQPRPPASDDRDIQQGSFDMVSPRMQTPQPSTPEGLTPEPLTDTNWPLPSPLASPTFGTGHRPHTPSEGSEVQMSPGREGALDARRPDFGLRAPTGIADEFRVGFI